MPLGVGRLSHLDRLNDPDLDQEGTLSVGPMIDHMHWTEISHQKHSLSHMSGK